MEVQILSFFDIDIEDATKLAKKTLKNDNVSYDKVRTLVGKALKDSIQIVLQEHFKDDPFVNLTLIIDGSNLSSRINGCEMCNIQRTFDGTYLIFGDDKLSKDLQEKLGPRAKRLKHGG